MELQYQPIVNLANSTPVKLEAFYRPSPPVAEVRAFIVAAERTGGIKKLLQETLEAAFGDWPKIARPFLALSINVSIANLDEPDLAKRLEKLLKKSRFDGRNLWFEIEDALQGVDDPKRIGRMKELGSLGVRFSVDGFGGGLTQSTLYDLQRLPLDELKIDGRIVSDADVNMQHRSDIRTSVEIARQIRVGVSAKGIERPEIAALMLRLGCTYGQGYYFARPANSADIGATIDRLRIPGA
jgi:EAL domain-containing protein (putative c-di-GMP-specific phosphodiesterase class I)